MLIYIINETLSVKAHLTFRRSYLELIQKHRHSDLSLPLNKVYGIDLQDQGGGNETIAKSACSEEITNLSRLGDAL